MEVRVQSTAALGWLLAFWMAATSVWIASLHESPLTLSGAVLLHLGAITLLCWTLFRTLPSVGEVLPLVFTFLFFNLQVDTTLSVWSVPLDLQGVFTFSRAGATLLVIITFCVNAGSLAVRGRGLHIREVIALVMVPCLFNWLLLLVSPVLPAQSLLLRVLVVLIFNLTVVQLLASVTRQSFALHFSMVLMLSGVSVLVAFSPTLANVPWRFSTMLSLPVLHVAIVIVTAVLSQAALWAQTYLVTGLLMDALEGRPPTVDRARGHWQQGAYKGALYGGLFMTFIHLLAGGYHSLAALILAYPYVSGTLLGGVLFPVVKTIVESFDGSAPFVIRLSSSLRDPLNYLRGLVVGAGVVLALHLDLPGRDPWQRSGFGFALGAMVFAGVYLLRDGHRIIGGRRQYFQGWKVYLVQLVLGGVTGAALTWYGESSQLQVILQKFARYSTLAVESPEPYIIYPLFSKWGMLNLGLETSGSRLLFNESLSGVIGWSLAAPLFSLNMVFLTALLKRSTRPISEFATTDGLKKVIVQALLVERWGLWMAPIIFSFLRMAPDPQWYNQDGAIRTVVATGMAVVLEDTAFRNWSINVFVSLLAFDWLRILIWFDHMGLRVATLVNLSFIGGDMLDEKVARTVGYPAAARYIPEGLRRFGTWMPLLLPFYIPRGQEWVVAWNSAEQMSLQAPSTAPSASTLICAVFAITGVLVAVWRLRRGRSSAGGYSGWTNEVFRMGNSRYALSLDQLGRGFSESRRDYGTGGYIDLTRRPVSPHSPIGKIFYLTECHPEGTPQVWSLHASPSPAPNALYAAKMAPGKQWIYSCHHGELHAGASVNVDPYDPLERWDISLTNTGTQERLVQITSFRDLVLNDAGMATRQHSYNELHISSGFVPALQALFAANRLLGATASVSAGEVYFHALAKLPEHCRLLGFQDSRAAIVGAGSRQHPSGLLRRQPLLQEEGVVHRFDPCASLGVEVRLAPGAKITVTFVEGWAASPADAMHLLHLHLKTPLLTVPQLQQSLGQSRRSLPELPRPNDYRIPWLFSTDGRCLQVNTNTPRPWFHALANDRGYGAFANNQGAMYSFCGNSQQNAITPFSPALDSITPPGQAWYFWDMDADQPLLRLPLTLGENASTNDERELLSEFRPGSVRYKAKRAGFVLEMDVFTLCDQPAEGRLLTLRNEGEQVLRLRVSACLQLVLAELLEDSRGTLEVHWDATHNAFFAENPSQQFCRGPAFVATTFLPDAVETLYSHFIGERGSVEIPSMVRTGKPDPATRDTGYRVAAFTKVVVIPSGESLQLGLVLGQAPSMQEARSIIDKLHSPAALQQASSESAAWWQQFHSGLRVKTADPTFDRLVNDWLPYQLVTARLWGRSGPFQRGGAYGYRDHLQDVMPLAATHPDLCRKQILLHGAQQFLEGDVLQWWHVAANGETGIGARNQTSDIMLWLPYVTLHYCKVSGDHTIWNEILYFLEGKPIPPGHEGIVAVPLRSRERASLYIHCRLAIDRVLSQMGEHGLPLIGSGDWNDALDAMGRGGKGESVWLGFFLYGVLKDFVPLVVAQEGPEAGAQLLATAQQLKTTLEQQRRDNRYVRAISDSGEELVFDDALMSSWPILSGVADAGHGEEALLHGLNALERDAMVLLLDPAFDQSSKPYPGRITRYPPGVRENGAQYSHGSSWLVDAALQLATMLEEQGNGNAAKAWRDRAGLVWHKISPITHTAAQHWLNYGLEPHQQAADVYAGHGYDGRGGWSWYTGSAARMLLAARALLGMDIRDGQLHVADWAKKGDVWPHLQEVEWRGETIKITAPE